MFTSSKSRQAQAAARAEEARLVAIAARAARETNLRLRFAVARGESQRRFDALGLPRYAGRP